MSVELIYYKPRVLKSLQDEHFAGVGLFSSFFDMYDAGSIPVDRTGTIRTPVNVKSLFPIPTLQRMTKSFEELCNERARELLVRAEKMQVPLSVMWSGGIDSTLVLVSLLKNASPEQTKAITVILSNQSIAEYPLFFDTYIRNSLSIKTRESMSSVIGSRSLFTNGEHNDQIFGSDLMRTFITRYGASVLHEHYNRDYFFEHFVDNTNSPEAVTRYLDLFERLYAAAPIPLTTNFEHAWWINFCLKWQTVYARMLTFAAPENASFITPEYTRQLYEPFYNTEDFQLWALNNPDKRIKDDWKSYKWVCKDIIYDFTKDADYRDNKQKNGSLELFVYNTDSFPFLDSSFQLLKDVPPELWYIPQNDFCK